MIEFGIKDQIDKKKLNINISCSQDGCMISIIIDRDLKHHDIKYQYIVTA